MLHSSIIDLSISKLVFSALSLFEPSESSFQEGNQETKITVPLNSVIGGI